MKEAAEDLSAVKIGAPGIPSSFPGRNGDSIDRNPLTIQGLWGGSLGSASHERDHLQTLRVVRRKRETQRRAGFEVDSSATSKVEALVSHRDGLMKNTTNAIRVLLVDDEPEVTRSLRIGLRRTGWEIETADSGDEALTLIRAQPFDVVVSDERMPGMQGSDFLTLVKAEFPNTLRITLSGQASLERAVHAINSAEIHRFLMKPCPPSEVQATIEELLEKRDVLNIRSHSRKTDAAREQEALIRIFEAAMDSMYLSFQPLWSRTEKVYGYEALLRTELSLIRGPEHFFDIAEMLHRSMELSARIRDMVASEIDHAPDDSLIFVNVNPDHLDDPSLYLETSPLSRHAHRVVIEITERSAVTPGEDLMESLDRLTDLGFLIAVDDLGAGYSGLNTFSLLTPTVIKFDMEMIRNIDCSPTKQAVVGAISDLCKSLGIISVAEGIETHEEYLTAKALGCTLFQGFLLGKPEKGFSLGTGYFEASRPDSKAA